MVSYCFLLRVLIVDEEKDEDMTPSGSLQDPSAAKQYLYDGGDYQDLWDELLECETNLVNEKEENKKLTALMKTRTEEHEKKVNELNLSIEKLTKEKEILEEQLQRTISEKEASEATDNSSEIQQKLDEVVICLFPEF